MRPEVSWKRVRGGKAWHIFLEGSDTPVCGTAPSASWTTNGSARMPVHKQCWQKCPHKPRLNAVMTEEALARELD